MKARFVALVQTLCPRVFPQRAPLSTPKPYVTYQSLGGPSDRYLDRQPLDKKCTRLQVNTWAATQAQADALMKQIAAAMHATPVFQAWCEGEAEDTHDDIELPDAPQGLFGARQDFIVWWAEE